MTAEELFEDYKEYTALSEGHFDYLINNEDFKKALIEFAKYHVEQALKKAMWLQDPEHIKNCYSLENIK